MDAKPAKVPFVASAYTMRRKTCDRIAHIVAWLIKRSKLGIKPSGGDQYIPEGDIFLFNHFTRFETIITTWLLYRKTGQFCRSVAHHSLFGVHEKFSRLLRAVGVLPNNMEGLLPFLAAEVMRGHKVLIFPEGGMVKDRKVKGEEGGFNVFSSTSNRRRQHHRGAAVLAIALDIFKHHLRTLEAAGDAAALERWRAQLGLESVQLMLTRAHQPTRLLPGNITYFPIRTGRNWLSRLLQRFLPDAPQQALEEVIIEGNILFKRTDMDIHFGPPLLVKPQLSKGEVYTLATPLRHLAALEGLFNREGENGGALAKFIAKESEHIRARYMEAIYGLTTLNINHLVATAIHVLVQKKQFHIEADRFHLALYAALKTLQANPALHLQCSISRPQFYGGLHLGKGRPFKGFIHACTTHKLLKLRDGVYKLSHRLEDEFDDLDIRLENPVALHANEAATVPALREALEHAFEHVPTPEQLADWQFDDQLRAYRQAWTYFTHRHPQWAPTLSNADAGAPYLLKPKGFRSKKPALAVVLVHGFTDHPGQLRAFGEHLCNLGHVVVGARLPGHGTTPYDMEKHSRKHWQRAVQRSYEIAAAHAHKVAVVGFSTGGAVALTLAGNKADKLTQLAGVVSVATPLIVQDKNMNLLPLVMLARTLLGWIPAIRAMLRFYPAPRSEPGQQYPVKPVLSLNELRLLMAELPSYLPRITVPVQILQGTADETVDPVSAETIFNGLVDVSREKHMLEGGPHGLLHQNFGATWQLVTDFLKHLASGEGAPHGR
ncbi:MAG: alpha/beta fold hydrolase [Pseudomonadaceae bacterium]|nr:alpha/beta fold hydrolase [Pseudomonadaceae bacterium]